MKDHLSVLKIELPDEKSSICNQILNSLPNWFGIPESIVDYIEQVRTIPMFAYKEANNVLGFIACKEINADTAEIIVMGVLPEHHRQGIGRKLLDSYEEYCLDCGIQCLTVKTLAESHPSVNYAKTRSYYFAMGFYPQMILTDYWDKANPCLCMVKAINAHALNVIQMQDYHIEFVYEIKRDYNKDSLHCGDITLSEWQEACKNNLSDPDEANFIIRKGNIPVGWLKVNGLQGDMVWISMLVIQEKYQRQGIGSYAVCFAEDFVHLKGFTAIGIQTNVDNFVAQKCYKHLGYTIIDEGECTNGDGKKRRGLTFYRDHLDAVRMSIDGVSFHVGEPHDFSFISEIGTVFCVFDAMDSGNICFGVEREGKRYFVKYAGARTMDYKGKIADAVARLKSAVAVYEDLQHPYLIKLIDHFPVGDGYAAIFDWVDGEGLFSYWDYAGKAMKNCSDSPNYRFRYLPIEKRIAAVDRIMEFNQYVLEQGYIPVDFYDGSMIYDFNTDDFHICDIDFYRKAPTQNDMGKMWGSSRFMSPEEYQLGAELDEITTVFLTGASAFELLGDGIEAAYQGWSATKALFDVAAKATSVERNERYQSMAELASAWERAK